jgi:hypothetical protein
MYFNHILSHTNDTECLKKSEINFIYLNKIQYLCRIKLNKPIINNVIKI